jgi:outer membrane protein
MAITLILWKENQKANGSLEWEGHFSEDKEVNMKKFFTLVVGAILIFSFQHRAFCAGSSKFGVVDIEKFQEQSKSFQKIKEGLQEKFAALQKKLDEKKDELIEIENELKKQSMMLSLDAKEDKAKELETKRRHFKYLADDFTQEMKQAQLEARQSLAKELEKVVEKIGKKEGYTMIMEKRTIGLVYFDNALDITDQVIKEYDKMKK